MATERDSVWSIPLPVLPEVPLMWGKAVGLIGFQPTRANDEIDRYFDLEYRRESADYREILNRELRNDLKKSRSSAK
jgi:hypothetical protein